MTDNSNIASGGVGSSQTTTTESQPVLFLKRENIAMEKKAKSKSKSRPKVSWTDDVVDNEHMNKKKSKICCIFHPQREFGESSSDESSDSSSDSSDSNYSGDDTNKNMENGEHKECCNHSHKGKAKRKRHSSPNAYEKQPSYTNKSTLPTQASI